MELGRVDICCEVSISIMWSSLALPCSGHLEQLYHIFLYLRLHHNMEIIFDPTEPTIDKELFEKQDWSNSVYATDGKDLKETLPGNMLEPRGKGLTMKAHVDTDHTGELATKKSRTGFFILSKFSSYLLAFKETNVSRNINFWKQIHDDETLYGIHLWASIQATYDEN